ncbi:MAG: Ig-like domain-containing protein [Ruminococcus flavefaciens]|nr:Ig-like domain-containing protein [Ruminococcus flavefaciens]
MKKLIALLLAVMLCFTLCACGQKVESITLKESEIKIRVDDTYEVKYNILPENIKNPKLTWTSSDEKVVSVDETGKITALSEGEVDITVMASKKVSTVLKVTVGKKEVTKTNYTNIEGIYVDKSYKDKDNSSKKLVYLFYSVTSPDNNIKSGTRYNKITVDGINTYESKEAVIGKNSYMGNYHHSDYYKDINVGETVKFFDTYQIPESELKAGKVLTFGNSNIPETEKLVMLTDNIVFCKNAMEIAKKADPKGYKEETNKRKAASAEMIAKVKKEIDGYEWSFYVNSISYKLGFSSPNKFAVTTRLGSNGGSYSIKNGYVFCKYDSNGTVVEIPYEFKDGKFDFGIIEAFDVKA